MPESDKDKIKELLWNFSSISTPDCNKCEYNNNCPTYYHNGNAACITIYREKKEN